MEAVVVVVAMVVVVVAAAAAARHLHPLVAHVPVRVRALHGVAHQHDQRRRRQPSVDPEPRGGRAEVHGRRVEGDAVGLRRRRLELARVPRERGLLEAALLEEARLLRQRRHHLLVLGEQVVQGRRPTLHLTEDEEAREAVGRAALRPARVEPPDAPPAEPRARRHVALVAHVLVAAAEDLVLLALVDAVGREVERRAVVAAEREAGRLRGEVLARRADEAEDVGLGAFELGRVQILVRPVGVRRRRRR